MSPRPGHRAGLAIVRVEAEIAAPAKLLIRISTVDDVTQRDGTPAGEPFGDVDAAIAHLRGWLEAWAVAHGAP